MVLRLQPIRTKRKGVGNAGEGHVPNPHADCFDHTQGERYVGKIFKAGVGCLQKAAGTNQAACEAKSGCQAVRLPMELTLT